MEKKKLYIVLTKTTTVLSRLISFITHDRYTHASIALDKDLTAMYSFGRKRPNNPIDGGFCQEDLNKGVFAASKSLPYAIIQVDVTEFQYQMAKSIIENYSRSARRYSYNYLGLLLAWFGISYKCDYRFYCSEFVHSILKECEVANESTPEVIYPQGLIRHGKIIEQGDWKLKLTNLEANPTFPFGKKMQSNIA